MAGRDGAAADFDRLVAFNRAQLQAHARERFRDGGGTQPSVTRVVAGEAEAVFKDYADSAWLMRWFAPLFVYREASALERLAGIEGIPRVYRRVDGLGILIEYLPAPKWSRSQPTPAAHDRLEKLLTEVHARGVAHGDLRGSGNILLRADGQPCLVDFVARVHRGQPWNKPWNAIFRAFCQADRNALAKLKLRWAPELATAEECRRAEHHGWPARFARAVGVGVRRLVRLLVRQPDR